MAAEGLEVYWTGFAYVECFGGGGGGGFVVWLGCCG